MSDTLKVGIDIALMRTGFRVDCPATSEAFPESVLNNVVYVHIDADHQMEDDRTRPVTLTLGVAEKLTNARYMCELSMGFVKIPREIWIYGETGSKRAVVKRIFTNTKLKVSGTSYSKLPGAEREVLVHRLVINCYLKDAEFPMASNVGQ